MGGGEGNGGEVPLGMVWYDFSEKLILWDLLDACCRLDQSRSLQDDCLKY